MPGRKSEKETPAGEDGALSWIRPSVSWPSTGGGGGGGRRVFRRSATVTSTSLTRRRRRKRAMCFFAGGKKGGPRDIAGAERKEEN